MSQTNERPFSIERQRAVQAASLADVIARVASLEKTVSDGFTEQFKKLCDRLDLIVEDDGATKVETIMAEIQAMNDHITITKQEVAALKPVDDANTTLSIATEELAEVVRSTEIAANSILENTEQLDQIIVDLRSKIADGDPDGIVPDIEKIEFISMELLTACSFQDVTGQRITKVVNSLNYIEERLNKMIEIWNIENGTANSQEMALPKDDARADKDLLHGPQTEAAAMSQDDIDSMFD
ncbi:MAG: protein phosphatase CheZ [Rhodospirillales bacterium]|nr:protein phosphatase CheZ [Rhodospirillales bacterium]